jgi:uncharacterized repeat protein (TIGR03803 family)
MRVKYSVLIPATFALAACSASAPFTPSTNAAKAVFGERASVKEQVLYSFSAGLDGSDPLSTLITDSTHALYGTTAYGGGAGGFGCGIVFKLTPSGTHYTESILYQFKGSPDGCSPSAGVVEDASGALYGTTEYGGDSAGNGTVFKLTPAGSKYTETVLYAFQGGSDGNGPLAGLTIDAHGDLFGGTLLGGGASACPSSGCGILFELKRAGTGYKERVLHSFQSGTDGATPGSPPIFVGNALYGTAATGGGNPSCGSAPINRGCGTIYKLTPRAGGYRFSAIYRFTGEPRDGANPFGWLAFDKSSKTFYGISQYGGSANQGSVFSLTTAGSKEKVLHSFTGGTDGSYPTDGPVRAGHSLFGTTEYGGSTSSRNADGIAFELTPSGAKYTEKILYAFQTPAQGQYPVGGLLVGGKRLLYGTTSLGGSASPGAGTVFSLTY